MKDHAAWLAFIAAMIAIIVNIVMGYVDHREAREKTLLDHRREALFTALQVIDHVYANESLDGKSPVHPHSWDLQLARNAMNGILVYCEKPDRTFNAFTKALGLYNPSKQKPPGIDISSLDQFRIEVARELHLSSEYKGNPELTWINNLPGGEMQ